MDFSTYLQFGFALLFVLGLILGGAWLLRRAGLGGVAVTPRGRQKRLAVTDVLAIDNKRRLVLVRRDNVEHLILIGMDHQTVIEQGIAVPDDAPSGPGGLQADGRGRSAPPPVTGGETR